MLLSKQWIRMVCVGISMLCLIVIIQVFDITESHRALPNIFGFTDGLDQQYSQDIQYQRHGEIKDPGFITDNALPNVGLDAADNVRTLATEPNTAIWEEGIRKPDVIQGSGGYPTGTSSIVLQASQVPGPGDAAIRKTIVVGKLLTEDTTWTTEMMENGWSTAIYVVDLGDGVPSPTGLRTKINKAKETMPYLTYIVDHYDDFPDYAVFLHAHRSGWPQAWHNEAKDYDVVKMVNSLRLEAVAQRGFVNLRCNTDPGCPAEIQLNRDPSESGIEVDLAYPSVYGSFFNMTTEEVREAVPVIATPCCAQFGVSRSQVLKRPKAEYQRYIEYIEKSPLPDETLGRIMEYMWHIIFGREAIMCEKVDDCYAAVYGRPAGWTLGTD